MREKEYYFKQACFDLTRTEITLQRRPFIESLFLVSLTVVYDNQKETNIDTEERESDAQLKRITIAIEKESCACISISDFRQHALVYV